MAYKIWSAENRSCWRLFCGNRLGCFDSDSCPALFSLKDPCSDYHLYRFRSGWFRDRSNGSSLYECRGEGAGRCPICCFSPHKYHWSCRLLHRTNLDRWRLAVDFSTNCTLYIRDAVDIHRLSVKGNKQINLITELLKLSTESAIIM